MKLVIAEKYSYASNIAKALELYGEHFERHMNKANGYMQGQNYTVTWCFGHLLSLADISQYPGYEQSTKWTLDDLPFFPQNNRFRFVVRQGTDSRTHRRTGKPDPGAKKQLDVIGRLLRHSECVIAAGDADREGQVIVDLVLNYHRCSIPSFRLWVNDQTPESIAEGFKRLKPDSDYKNIYNEGIARTYMDWLYGINLTRLATIKAGVLLRVGRVIVPVVQAIVSRDKAIDSFEAKEYLKCVSSMEYEGVPLELASKHNFNISDQEEAERLCRKYNSSGGTVTKAERSKKTVEPPKLFSTSKLQAYLEDSMTPDQVLNAAESLYQKKYISYPRTEAEYLFPGDASKVKKILEKYPECVFRSNGAIFKKPKETTSHYALIPTGLTPAGLSGQEQLVYDAIETRFKEVFYAEPMTVDRTVMTIDAGDESFNVKGDIIRTYGWSRLEKKLPKSRTLPDFAQGQKIPLNFAPKKARTSPPKHFTPSELLSFMKNPFRKEMETDVQLGTEATRAGIIANAINTGYITQKGKYYYAMEKGKFLVDVLEKLNFGIDKSQSLSFADTLVKVRESRMSVSDALSKTEETIRKIFRNTEGQTADAYHPEEESLGKCPLCGKGNVIERKTKDGKAFYVCTENRKGKEDACQFFMFRRYKRFDDEIDITESKMKKLLAHKVISAKLTSRSGKKYDANMKLVMNGRWANLEPVFEDWSKNPSLGECPLCGKPVRNHGKFYRCDGHDDGCQFYIGSEIKFFSNGIRMNDDKVSKLLKGQYITAKIKSRDGKQLIDAKFVLQMNGRYANLMRAHLSN